MRGHIPLLPNFNFRASLSSAPLTHLPKNFFAIFSQGKKKLFNSVARKMELSNFQPLRLATTFLASLFLVSVIFSYSSLVPIIFNFLQYFSSNVDKNHMFLLCNGILVLIVKNAGLMGNSYKESDLYSEPSIIKNGGKAQKEVGLPATVVPQEVVVVEEKQVQETEDMALFAAADGKNDPLITQDVEEEEQRDELVVVDTEQRGYEEEEEEEEEAEAEAAAAIGLISTEELNKKCDDFIRMMKGIKH